MAHNLDFISSPKGVKAGDEASPKRRQAFRDGLTFQIVGRDYKTLRDKTGDDDFQAPVFIARAKTHSGKTKDIPIFYSMLSCERVSADGLIAADGTFNQVIFANKDLLEEEANNNLAILAPIFLTWCASGEQWFVIRNKKYIGVYPDANGQNRQVKAQMPCIDFADENGHSLAGDALTAVMSKQIKYPEAGKNPFEKYDAEVAKAKESK